MFHIRGPILKVFGIIPSYYYVTCGDILRLMALMLGINKLLAMAKDTKGLCFIVVSEVFI
jgi:hypothetical protein